VSDQSAEPDVREMMREVTTFQPDVIDPDQTAVLVIDMVNWQVPRAAADGTTATPYFVDRLRDLVIPAQLKLLAECRQAGVRVVYLRVGSTADDYSDAVPVLRGVFAAASARDGLPACEVIDEIAPEPGELSLMKSGSGAFTTSDLDKRLRDMGVRTLLYTGVVTNACVMLTLAAGFDLGYTGYLVSDATATLSQRLQEETENIVGSFLAEVIDTDKLIARLRLPAFERGLTTLEERADALPEVRCLAQGAYPRGLKLELFGQLLHGRAVGKLPQADKRQRRSCPCEQAGDLAPARSGGTLVGHLGREAVREQCRRVEVGPEQGHGDQPVAAERPAEQEGEAAVGRHAQLERPDRQPRRAADDEHIGRECQRGAGAHGVPLRRAYDRERQSPQPGDDPAEDRQHPVQLAGVRLEDVTGLPKVGADGEMRACAMDQDGARTACGQVADRRVQRHHGVEVECVATFWPVQRHVHDVRAALHDDQRHALHPSARAGCAGRQPITRDLSTAPRHPRVRW
jgi:nicotinamidase-related amidase